MAEEKTAELFISNCSSCPCCYAEKERGEHTMMCGMMGEDLLVLDIEKEVDPRCWLREQNFTLKFTEYVEPAIAAPSTGGTMPDSFEEE